MTDPSRVRVAGPLEPYALGFCRELERAGYTPLSAANQLRVMAHLSRWLVTVGVEPDGLTSARVGWFLADRRRAGYTCWLSPRGLAPLLGYLRRLGVVPEPLPVVRAGPVEELVEGYRVFLVCERGLAASTVGYYLSWARRFLSGRVGPGGVDLAGLTAGEVARFTVWECGRCPAGSAKLVVTTLRSLLRYLFMTGGIAADLAAAVPGSAGWRNAGLPKAIEAGQVTGLLEACDRARGVGRRDAAIVLMLVRLGLRAAEVASLELADIDWRAGEVIIRGKGGRQERLPLPVDVGQALVDYLRRGRPASRSRAVFVGARAPHGALAASGVKAVVRSASGRAGIVPAVGAHRLRHTTGTQLVRSGASLPEVAQVLRHRDLATTAIYAKVDHAALRMLARPWPVVRPGSTS